MSLSRSWAVARTSWRLQMRDPAPIIAMTLLPLVLIAFLVQSAKAQLVLEGYPNASGADQVVPGFAVLFAFLSVEQVVSLFYREYAWGTWDRLRTTPASTADIVTGKVVVRFVVGLVQTTLVFVFGAALFGYRPNGSVLGIAAVLIVFNVMLVAFGVMLVALFRTMDQAMVVGNLGGMIMAGLGGALSSVDSFPAWARNLAPVSPAYWTLDAVRHLTLDHGGFADVLPAIGITVAFAVGFAIVAGLRFRATAVKVGTT
ncbi:MAG TPA: ABC transporter permease [Pseudonocardiaceae bacterium]